MTMMTSTTGGGIWRSTSFRVSKSLSLLLLASFFVSFVSAIRCKCDVCTNHTCTVEGGKCFTTVIKKVWGRLSGSLRRAGTPFLSFCRSAWLPACWPACCLPACLLKALTAVIRNIDIFLYLSLSLTHLLSHDCEGRIDRSPIAIFIDDDGDGDGCDHRSR